MFEKLTTVLSSINQQKSRLFRNGFLAICLAAVAGISFATSTTELDFSFSRKGIETTNERRAERENANDTRGIAPLTFATGLICFCKTILPVASAI